ncbi:MAG TPA: TerC/Alx family metal homeostasis membrane protein [Verrucomicrobiae bacterium]|jgi:tellurite resistance protein TerC|nr:TerC/Alx family metal homeostasis membrane protein [Verrucomicrobiae bacterium]
MREALKASGLCFGLMLLFAGGLAVWRGSEWSLQFLTGYVIELSLSMDNVFAIALIFDYFVVPEEHRSRVLRWGILGAVLMRGLMIGVGAALIQSFHWFLYILGLFLLYTGVKWLVSKGEIMRPQDNGVVRFARKMFPVTAGFEGGRFLSQVNGRRALTPLALALLMVETTDLVFAVDSVPAIFSVTQNAFIVFTSNIFAILGLRSLYFVLVGAMKYFRYLRPGLACVLAFIGAKMLLAHWWALPTVWSLVGVGLILGSAMALSAVAAWRERR